MFLEDAFVQEPSAARDMERLGPFGVSFTLQVSEWQLLLTNFEHLTTVRAPHLVDHASRIVNGAVLHQGRWSIPRYDLRPHSTRQKDCTADAADSEAGWRDTPHETANARSDRCCRRRRRRRRAVALLSLLPGVARKTRSTFANSNVHNQLAPAEDHLHPGRGLARRRNDFTAGTLRPSPSRPQENAEPREPLHQRVQRARTTKCAAPRHLGPLLAH